MSFVPKLALLCLVGGSFIAAAQAADLPDSPEFFENRIRPVFARNCVACHGTTRMGGLDMSSREGLLRGGASGPAIVPGDSKRSLLIQAVSHQHEKIRMPLQQARLADDQIADLAEWVKAGAHWPEALAAPAAKAAAGSKYTITAEQRSFWSLQPIRKPDAPAVKQVQWAQTDIDRFLLAKMESKGVQPAPAADRRTLIRRVYYDLTGLPPTVRQIEEFVQDKAPNAWAKLVDRLLDSPRYGERWGRYWLDLARYSDDRLESEVDAPYANAFRYRDWVIRSFNEDLPYDLFVKAQIAGDLIGTHEQQKKLSAGLGFYGLRPDTQDDRVDATGRVFLGLTTGCAECHNHKFDPIPTTDFYALQGVFDSTENAEIPLAPEATVNEYKAREKAASAKKAQIRDFLYAQAQQLAEMLAQQTARYVAAIRARPTDLRAVAEREKLDLETLERWSKYLARGEWQHPFLKDWASAKFDPARFQEDVLAVWKERKTVDEENAFRRAEAKRKGPKAVFEPVSLKPESFYLWRDLFFNDFYGNQFKQEDDGLLFYGPNRGFYESDGTIERFLSGGWKDHLDRLRLEAKELRAQVPPPYPFLHAIKDAAKPRTQRVRIGGKAENLGDEVPRRFLTALCDGEPAAFDATSSGRRELAEAIASPKNPLTARVMANRIWHHHFGAGIVRTPSDFGFMGDRPSHPELLDYLAARFIESGWSVKALHREILNSAAYRLSTAAAAGRASANLEIDPDNRLVWRANMRRLDAEAMRDSLLAVTGELDLAATGGAPSPLTDAKNHRRSAFGLVSRRKLDGTLALFDFPNANATSEKRSVTITPTQQLFFLNSEFLMDRAKHLAARLPGNDEAAKLRGAYEAIFGRAPVDEEIRMGLEFLRPGRERWPLYVQALLTSNEFVFVN